MLLHQLRAETDRLAISLDQWSSIGAWGDGVSDQSPNHFNAGKQLAAARVLRDLERGVAAIAQSANTSYYAALDEADRLRGTR
jgi:hypothetical protein